MSQRKPVTIRFRYNKDTGQVEEFLIDDGDRSAPEAYHNKIARAIAGRLLRHPEIRDAGADALDESLADLTPEQIAAWQRNKGGHGAQ